MKSAKAGSEHTGERGIHFRPGGQEKESISQKAMFQLRTKGKEASKHRKCWEGKLLAEEGGPGAGENLCA